MGIFELIIIGVVAVLILGPILLIILSFIPPKTPNKGTFIAIVVGPIASINVGRW